MNLIDDVYAVFAYLRWYAHLINQRADIFYRVVGRCVQLVDIKRSLFVEGCARLALVACFMLLRWVQTVNGFGKDAGAGGFTYTARSAE
jgi:hypothetical protein